jgi:hypothetical protein
MAYFRVKYLRLPEAYVDFSPAHADARRSRRHRA